jgi:quinol monooxygenase YgiN
VEVARRPVLAGLALALLGSQAKGRVMEESQFYGLIGRITAVPGRRDDLIDILRAGTGTGVMPGCRAYIVAEDRKDPDAIWFSEVWDSKEAHDASLSIPAVREAIAKGRPLIAGFETTAETRPVAGIPGQ